MVAVSSLREYVIDSKEYRRYGGNATTDVGIITSRGSPPIAVHSFVLESSSPVLEKYVEKFRQKGRLANIPISGFPYDAIVAFLRSIYNNQKCSQEEIEKYAMHLLVLSHSFYIPQLKKQSAKRLMESLTAMNVVDVLHLAKLCNAPCLQLKCLKFISKDFDAVARSDGWRFLRNNDPNSELEILKFLEEAEMREKRRVRKREEEKVYLQLIDAMEALVHICTDQGCPSISPLGKADHDLKAISSSDSNYNSSNKYCGFSTCKNVEELIHHFAKCPKKVRGGIGCTRCKRMWQLLQLHSYICDNLQKDATANSSSCKVPFCRLFKLRMGGININGNNNNYKKDHDDREVLQILAKRIATTKALSSVLLKKQRDILRITKPKQIKYADQDVIR